MVQKAFYKDNLGQISLDALCSHITLCAEMGRKENDLVNNFLTSEKMYLKAEKKYSKNIKYLTYGVDLYKYLLKHDKIISKIGCSKSELKEAIEVISQLNPHPGDGLDFSDKEDRRTLETLVQNSDGIIMGLPSKVRHKLKLTNEDLEDLKKPLLQSNPLKKTLFRHSTILKML